MHGDSLTIDMERKLVRELVEKEQCKLILYELPFDYMLMYELFIQGDIKEEEMMALVGRKVLLHVFNMDFLRFLKDYNALSAEKVHIIGVDPISLEYSRLLPRFLQLWEKTDSPENIDSLRKLIRREKIPEAVCFWEKHKGEWQKEAIWNACLFSAALNQLTEQKEILRRIGGIVDGKDKIMQYNVRKWVDSVLPAGKQAVLIGHFLHLNKVSVTSPYWDKSCGNYLAEKYGDEYGVVGILRGEGSVWGRTLHGFRKYPLVLPHKVETLENACYKEGDASFMGEWTRPDVVGWIRMAGAMAERIWYASMSLSRRMDYFLWIK